jgi:hypothetical protein
MRFLAAVLAFSLLPASSFAVGGDAMVSGMGFNNPDVTPDERLGLALATLVLVGSLADTLRTREGWRKPLTLAVFVGAAPSLRSWASGWSRRTRTSKTCSGGAAWTGPACSAPGRRSCSWSGSPRSGSGRPADSGCRPPPGGGRRPPPAGWPGALGNAIVPTHARGVLHMLVCLALLGVVGAAGVLIAVARLWRRWCRRRRAAGAGPWPGLRPSPNRKTVGPGMNAGGEQPAPSQDSEGVGPTGREGFRV